MGVAGQRQRGRVDVQGDKGVDPVGGDVLRDVQDAPGDHARQRGRAGVVHQLGVDVQAIVDLTGKIRQVWEAVGKKQGRLGRLQLSVNPFVPKPWTPLQWAAMERRSSLEKKYRLLQKQLRPVSNVDLNLESLRHAELQGLLARGDRRVAKILPLLAEGKSLKAACQKAGLDPAFYLYRERGADELFP